MAYLVIENFANGLDLRKSRTTAPPGSLRVLRNAFINEGGEIEKRKAFQEQDVLTTYGQTAAYKGNIVGPMEVSGFDDTVFVRHRDNTLPGGTWSAGSGTEAESQDLHSDIEDLYMRVWAMRSSVTPPNFGTVFRTQSYSEHGDTGHVLEMWYPTNDDEYQSQHIEVTFTGEEPTAESHISANDDRAFQLVLQDKGYLVDGPTFYSSAISDPGDMATAPGAGSADTRVQSKPPGDLLALGEYFGQLVLFGRRGAQFWQVDPTFASNQYLRSIKTPFFAPRSATPYADGDLLYLSPSGIRSLQARDSSNQAAVSDVGSPIDSLIREALARGNSEQEAVNGAGTDTLNADFYDLALGIIHEDTGHFWLCLQDKIYVLSRYPDASVRAWAVYDLPVPDADNLSVNIGTAKCQWVADMCPIQQNLIFRNFADEFYVYGGTNGDTYDASEVEVVTPHMDFGRPGNEKVFTGIDIDAFGRWEVEVSLDPDNVIWERIATIEGNSTTDRSKIPMDLSGTAIALRLKSTSEFAAVLSQIVVYYKGDKEK